VGSQVTADRKTILCIDDHEASAAGWCLYLQNAGYAVETAYSAMEGLQLFATTPIDLVLLDYKMPDTDGGQVAADMKKIKPQVPILLFTGVSQIPDGDRAHIDAFLEKGQNPVVVLQKIDELLERSERPPDLAA
jgi:CheY-like chemotaxis protein